MDRASLKAWQQQPKQFGIAGTEPISAPRAMTLWVLGMPEAASMAVHLPSLPRLPTNPTKDLGQWEALGYVGKLCCTQQL